MSNSTLKFVLEITNFVLRNLQRFTRLHSELFRRSTILEWLRKACWTEIQPCSRSLDSIARTAIRNTSRQTLTHTHTHTLTKVYRRVAGVRDPKFAEYLRIQPRQNSRQLTRCAGVGGKGHSGSSLDCTASPFSILSSNRRIVALEQCHYKPKGKFRISFLRWEQARQNSCTPLQLERSVSLAKLQHYTKTYSFILDAQFKICKFIQFSWLSFWNLKKNIDFILKYNFKFRLSLIKLSGKFIKKGEE